MTMFIKLIILGILVLNVYSNIILEPKKQHNRRDKDYIFIIFPQVDVPASAYNRLGRAIQDASPLTLWVGIVESDDNSHHEVDDVVTIIHDITKDVFHLKKNSEEVEIILGGHGQSGSLVQHFVSEHPNTVKGIVLMSTHVLMDRKLLHLNVPAMTLTGNLDGVTKVTTLARVYEKFKKEISETPDLKYRYPIVVLDGVNHGIFSNGQLPLQLLIEDIPSDRHTTDLFADIARCLSMFFIYCKGNYNSDVLAQFDVYLKETADMLEPLINAEQITSADYQSYWVKQSQLWLSEIVGPNSTRINVESYFTYQSAFDPALFEDSPSKITIYLFSQLDTPLETSDTSFKKLPSQIHARMFRRDRILQMLGMNQQNNSNERTCKDLNYASYLIAYYTSHEKVRRRFDKRNPGFIVHEDIVMPSEDEWKNKNIIVTRESDVLHVTSFAYVTNIENDTGHIFCTLLPPIRAMDWIYYKIFK